jgi:hypothetical protein
MLTGMRKQLKCGGWKKVGLGKSSTISLDICQGILFLFVYFIVMVLTMTIFLMQKKSPISGGLDYWVNRSGVLLFTLEVRMLAMTFS